MAEYIEREALLNRLCKENCDRPFEPENAVCVNCYLGHVLNREPAADVVPAKRGRWEWFDEDTGTPATGYEREWGWRCSCCQTELPDNYDDPDRSPEMNYCPYCGAKMDVEE